MYVYVCTYACVYMYICACSICLSLFDSTWKLCWVVFGTKVVRVTLCWHELWMIFLSLLVAIVLQSGRMYYLNKKTATRSYNWPFEQNIDLDLNISTLSSSDEVSSKNLEESKKPSKSNSSSTMVAAACFKCHLLVMLSKSSPSCPNCKYLHSLPTQPSPPPEVTTVNSLETLRLLN